jgi:hypothetical protein
MDQFDGPWPWRCMSIGYGLYHVYTSSSTAVPHSAPLDRHKAPPMRKWFHLFSIGLRLRSFRPAPLSHVTPEAPSPAGLQLQNGGTADPDPAAQTLIYRARSPSPPWPIRMEFDDCAYTLAGRRSFDSFPSLSSSTFATDKMGLRMRLGILQPADEDVPGTRFHPGLLPSWLLIHSQARPSSSMTSPKESPTRRPSPVSSTILRGKNPSFWCPNLAMTPTIHS